MVLRGREGDVYCKQEERRVRRHWGAKKLHPSFHVDKDVGGGRAILMASQSLTPRFLRFDHNVARYCRPRWIVHGIVSRDAFLLRDGEQYLSTNWLEYFHQSDRGVQISGVRAALAGKNFNIHPNGGFAILNVGHSGHRVLSFLRVGLSFQVLGQVQDPSHTGVFERGSASVGAKGNDVAQLLAASVFEIHPASP